MATTDAHETDTIDLTSDNRDDVVAGETPSGREPLGEVAADLGVDEGSAPSTSARNDYVVPIVHARIPEPFVNMASWGALGAVAVVGALDLPVVGVLAGGLFVIRRRHRH